MHIGAIAAGLAVAAGGTYAVMDRVVDGDTIDVLRGGERIRVRLLNIDTPESVDPNRPVECLGVEASSYLAGLLPQRTEVELRYDEERRDRYDRELAGVFVDDVFVNAAIAQAGYGTPLLIEPNDHFYGTVELAWARAETEGAGLFDARVGCTLVSQVHAYETAAQDVADAAAAPQSSGNAMNEISSEATSVAGGADAILPLLALDAPSARGYSGTRLADLRQRASTAADKATTTATDVDDVIDQRAALEQVTTTLEGLEEVITDEADKQEKARALATAEREAEAEAQREAEAKRVAKAEDKARVQREKDRMREQDTQGSSRPKSGPKSPAPQEPAPPPQPAPAPSKPGAGYTGCRNYNVPGPYLDSKGRGYMPIDCTTKAPLAP